MQFKFDPELTAIAVPINKFEKPGLNIADIDYTIPTKILMVGYCKLFNIHAELTTRRTYNSSLNII